MYLDPGFIDEFLTWDPMFKINRTMQRTFFQKYFTDLSKIADETADAPLYWRDMKGRSLPVRLLYTLKARLLKSSLRRHHWLSKDKDFKKLLLNVTCINDNIIKKYFPILNIEDFYKINPRGAANFVKIFMVIDTILNCRNMEQGEYLEKKYK